MTAEPPQDPDPPDPDPPAEPDALERAILGEQPTYSATEVAEAAGVDLDEARRLWRALGFPEYDHEVAFTEADVEALRTVFAGIASGLVDFDTVTNLTRGLGQTMARLADWEVATLVNRIDELEQGEQATGSRRGSATRLAHEVQPAFERLIVYAWRRHLAAAAGRVEALRSREEDVHTTQVTVGFADLVSFTALSNELEDDRIGDLVEVFESRCSDVVTSHGGRVIKSLGDSVLFVTEDAREALAIAEGIIQVIGRDSRMPDVRLGLASGSVVMRLGDVFGPPVNMASRLTTVARRNRVIVDNDTAAALPAAEYETRRLPARPVRGFGLVEPVAVRRY